MRQCLDKIDCSSDRPARRASSYASVIGNRSDVRSPRHLSMFEQGQRDSCEQGSGGISCKSNERSHDARRNELRPRGTAL
jgi:hypothetical protein